MFVQTATSLLIATCLTLALPSDSGNCPLQAHYLLPDELDCTKFYYCEYGYRRRDVSRCAPGTVFSVENQVCVHPSKSSCQLPNPVYHDDDLNQNDADTYPFEIDDRFSPEISIVIPIDVHPNGCPVSRHVHKLQPHETECDMFYQCADGKKILKTCAPGTYYNSNKQVCDLPSNVICITVDSNLDQSQQENNKNADIITESVNESKKPADDVVINFDNSNVNEEINREESVGNLEETYENDFKENTDKLENGCPSDFSIHHTIPHETDCDKYYLCNFGKRIRRECGPGNWYDDKLEICTWPHLAKCVNSKSPKNERILKKEWNQ